MHEETRTVRIVPATFYYTSPTTVTNPDNALTDTDSDTYATITSTNTPTGYFTDFDISAVPTDAYNVSYAFKIKANTHYSGTQVNWSYTSGKYSKTTNLPTNGVQTSTLSNMVSGEYMDTSWSTLVTNAIISSNPLYSYPQIAFTLYTTGSSFDVYGVELQVTYTAMFPDDHGIFNLILPRG